MSGINDFFCIASLPKTSETDWSVILFWYIVNSCIVRATKPTTSPLRNTRNTAEITLIQVPYVVFIENWPAFAVQMVITCNHQILAWTVLLRHCSGSHSEGCLHVPFRPMSLGEKWGRKKTRLPRWAVSNWQDKGICTSIFQFGCWTLRDSVFWHPKHHPFSTPKGRFRNMLSLCEFLVFGCYVILRKGYPIDFPVAYHSSSTWKLPLGPHGFEEGDFWMFQLFKNGFLMLSPPKKMELQNISWPLIPF